MITEKVKALIAYSGKSQASISRELGETPQSLNNRINRNSISVADLVKIASATGCKVLVTDNKGFTVEFNTDDL